jgi:hypothetical protein
MFWRYTCDQDRDRNNFKIFRFYNRKAANVECENNSDTSSNRGQSVSESFRKNLSNIPDKHDVKELEKTAILGTAHTVWVTNTKLQMV